MAGLATRLGGSALPGLSLVTGPAKLLALPNLTDKVSKANIYSKTSGNLEPRMKPWPYEKLGFNYWYSLIDGTTKRFTDNTKMIVVEGPPGLQKTKFAQELAEELDMLYVPGATMDHYYINSYGYDLRDLDHLMKHEKNVSYDEKKFAQNPMGQNGGVDRMLTNLLWMRLNNYTDALAHLFNTGQGIVTEKSPFSEHVFIDAAFKQGWISRTSKIYLNKIRAQTIPTLLKPNLIIYLDAPIDAVQSKIRERAKTTHPWELNSPVYEDTAYLTMVYEDMMKRDYIAKAAINSKVLMYDWSEGGDTEVVVEDIERLNMDYFDKYDKQQEDWRMFKEDNYAAARLTYTQRERVLNNFKVDYWEHDRILRTPTEYVEFMQQAFKLPGNQYIAGFNAEEGDTVPLVKVGIGLSSQTNLFTKDTPYTLDTRFLDDENFWGNYWAVRKAKKERGEANYWNF